MSSILLIGGDHKMNRMYDSFFLKEKESKLIGEKTLHFLIKKGYNVFIQKHIENKKHSAIFETERSFGTLSYTKYCGKQEVSYGC